MVKYNEYPDTEQQLDAVFGALADQTRRAILARLAAGPARVTDLAAPFAMSLPAVSKHLKVLERAGLLARDRDGRVHRCRLDAAALSGAEIWIERTRTFWEQSFDKLAQHLKTREGTDDGRKDDGQHG